MPLTDGIGTVFSAAFLTQYYQTNVWMGVVDDRSAELEFGDSIDMIVSDFDTVVTPRSKSTAQSDAVSSLTWGQPHVGDVTKATLTIDRYPEVQELVPLVAATQIRPNLVAEKGQQAARKLLNTINDDIRDKVNAVTDARARLTDITVTAANWGNENHVTAIFNAFEEAALEMDEGYIPEDGRNLYTSPDMYNLIVKSLIERKLFLVNGLNDQMVVDRTVPRYYGFNIMKDNSVGAGHSATDDDKHTMYFLRRGEGITFAGQLRNFRTFQSEQFKGYLIQALYAYGAAVNQPEKIRLAKTVIS